MGAAEAAVFRVVDNGLKNLVVLIVDDHANMRKIVNTILHALGIQFVYEANDGADGFEAMRAYNPDIMIVDWEMPGIDGIEFTELVRKASDSPNPYVPIIFLTSYSDRKHVCRARDAGVTEFLAKPVSANAVYLRFMSIINKPRAFVSSRNYFGPCRRRHISKDYTGRERRVSESFVDA
ncbi:MAG: response regulator [Alphaproteobacteria bacterium]|nr:response regulator [Alphaproteobacteria bacterium]